MGEMMQQDAIEDLPGCPFLSEGQPPSLEHALNIAHSAKERDIITNRQCALLAVELDPIKIIAEVQAWEELDLPAAESTGLISPALRYTLQLYDTSTTPMAIMHCIRKYNGVVDAALVQEITEIVRGHPWFLHVTQALDSLRQPVQITSWDRPSH